MLKKYLPNILEIIFILFIFMTLIFSSLITKASKPLRWIVYYGPDLTEKDLHGVDLAILDPDNITPKKFSNQSVKYIGYVSIGEAERYRYFWPSIKGKPFVLGSNPEWPGSYRIDIRSPEWQSLLLNQIIPDILAKGYDGIFLDTIDTATYLQDLNAKKYGGSEQAMIGFIKTLRQRFPHIMIIPNNGLEMLDNFADDVDAVVVEDLYTRYNFKKKTCEKTPEPDSVYKEKYLDQFVKSYHKPVLNILYEKSLQTPVAKEAIKRSQDKGYKWYLTGVDLMKLGTVGD